MVAEVVQYTPTQIFKSQWSDYSVVLEEDYLEHRGLYSPVHKYLQQKANLAGPLKLLDLGCGDSCYISSIIKQAGGPKLLASYTGVDLSEAALEVSRQNIARALGDSSDASWHCQDFLAFTGASSEDVDVVLMSFALHHLRKEDKAILIKNVHRLLQKRRGILMVVDIMRLPGETLSDYQVRSQMDLRDNWVKLAPTALKSFTDHMLKFDFPETFATFEEMAAAAGFKHVRSLHLGTKRLAQAIVFEQ